MKDLLAYKLGKFHRKQNRLKSSNIYVLPERGLLGNHRPGMWLDAHDSWNFGWDDQDTELAMEMS